MRPMPVLLLVVFVAPDAQASSIACERLAREIADSATPTFLLETGRHYSEEWRYQLKTLQMQIELYGEMGCESRELRQEMDRALLSAKKEERTKERKITKEKYEEQLKGGQQ